MTRNMFKFQLTYPKKIGHIYILKCDKFYKIGISSNVDVRVKGIIKSYPHEIILLHTIKTDQCSLLESALHISLMEYHHKGEWFILPEWIVNLLIKFTEKDCFLILEKLGGLAIKNNVFINLEDCKSSIYNS